MAQKLFIKTSQGQRPVQVIRCWMAAGGNSVYLHANGRYAYKDGAPLKSAADLDILPGAQRERARAWWDRAGRVESEAYYEAQRLKEKEAAGDFRAEVPFAAELDAVNYIRRKTGGGKTLAPSAPHAWMEWFPARPDWWGQARTISFADYTYEMVEAGAQQGKAPADPEPSRGDTPPSPDPPAGGKKKAPAKGEE